MANILIVDDSNLMRRNLRHLLEKSGHKVVGEALDGAEAYSQYVKTKPDLVTMDITMPRMNGIEAVKKILAADPQASIIMISAIDQKSMVLEAIQLGAKHYIIKPVTEEKIVQTIEKILLSDAAEAKLDSDTAGAGTDAEADGGEEPAFSMENRDGWIVFSFRGAVDEEMLRQVGQSMQGLMFLKPLRVAFRFSGIEELKAADLDTFRAHANAIEKAGGTAKAVCTEDKLYGKLVSLAAFTDIQAE